MSTLTITTIQSKLEWESKPANLRMLGKKIDEMEERTEIVVLPEMFSTGFSMQASLLAEKMDGETVEWMREIAARNKIILTGSLIIEENGRYFNRLIWMLPNGQFGAYDKRHLFAYAEEDKYYTAGNKRLVASVKGWKINLQICYDLRFPVWARNQLVETATLPEQRFGVSAPEADPAIAPEYDILVYVANWPERRNHAWKTLLCARAIENQCYVVGVNRVGRDGNNINYSGNSLVIDPLGEVLYHVADEEDVFTINLQKDQLEEVRTKFPFWKESDHFTLH
ncbi:MAG: nitrilase family protein [Ferruginibacter sp.]